MIRGSKHLTRNVALEVDTTTVQSPGLKVTEEEQNLADTGLLEFTFQVEFKLKSNDTEIGMFQEFVRNVTNAEKVLNSFLGLGKRHIYQSWITNTCRMQLLKGN